MGIEGWRKHSTTGSGGGSSPALGTEYDDLVRREEAARGGASVGKVELPSPRRSSEPDHHLRELYSMGIPVRNLDAEYPAPPPPPSQGMSGKNVKGLRLPLSDTNAASVAATAIPAAETTPSSLDAESPGPSGLLSPAFISGDPTSPSIPLASPLSMGEASRGTRRKPVPATFATTAPVRRVSGEVGQ